MRITKQIITFIALLFFSNVLSASDLLRGNLDSKANMMVEKLCKDLVLTDNQKAEIKKKAKVFIDKNLGANEISNNESLILAKRENYKEYKMALDSILTTEQRDQLAVKQNERNEIRNSKRQINK